MDSSIYYLGNNEYEHRYSVDLISYIQYHRYSTLVREDDGSIWCDRDDWCWILRESKIEFDDNRNVNCKDDDDNDDGVEED